MHGLANHVCMRCRRQKRKCDKRLPICSLCKRLNRTCSYDEPHATLPSMPISLPFPDLNQVTQSNLSHAFRAQVFSIIGDERSIRQAAAGYFRTIHTWLPVVTESFYYDRLAQIRTHSPAEFSMLTICLFLLGSFPKDEDLPMKARSLYILVKGAVGTIDAIGTNSLDLLQCRLLLAIFEVGHGLYPSAYVSMGTCVRTAMALGVDATSVQQLQRVFGSPERAEEARRTWQGVVITDRYVCLESGKRPSITKESEGVGGNMDIELQEPSSPSTLLGQLNQFTKLTQASRLLEQVLAHVYEPTSHLEFNTAEAFQIVKTLTSFRATLHEEETTNHVLWSGSVALCRSALMTILELGCHIKHQDSEYCNYTSLRLLESIVEELVHLSASFGTRTSMVNLEVLPVFVPHCIYKAIMVLLRDMRDTPRLDVRQAISSLKSVLDHIGFRWLAGRRYLDEIDREMVAAGMTLGLS